MGASGASLGLRFVRLPCKHMFAMKLREATAARRLRGERGWSVKRIAKELGVSVSSVSVWVRDVELSPRQRAELDQSIGTGRIRGNTLTTARARAQRQAYQASGRELARGSSRPLHAIGCMLFWGEGSRRRNTIVFTNADADMHRVFLRFLRTCYGIGDTATTLTINCFLGNGLTRAEIEGWWLAELRLPRECLLPTIVNRPSKAGAAKRRTLPRGTARITVHSTAIVQSIYGAIQEYAGVDRPEWLDLR